MDYLRFVARQTASCDAFERGLERARRNPRALTYDELEGLVVHYRRLLHGQALAAARFPGTGIARRLSQLAVAGTHVLQRDALRRRMSLRSLVTRALPRAFRSVLPAVGVAAALFSVAALAGLTLTAVVPEVGSLFLGPEALAGLRRGELWTESIFAVTPGEVASSHIATNNLGVALTAWAGGALAGLGAIWIVLMNGFMLGAVLAVTWHYGMAGDLGAFIAAHGPLEISLILISAGAGLEVGRALVVAGDRPRGERLRDAARRSALVLGGCLPWFLLLGFIEGFVSPAPNVATTAKLAFGLLLETLFLLSVLNPWLPPQPADAVER
ncbi:MAG: stage II sporulation protein M [Acidobacteria bacterium]|nr:MAG: stage II sporulation protein M [Acidobacteriota bacterium]